MFEGHDEIVRFLLSHGANPCACDMNEATPLHEAAAHSRYHCVQILLDHHAPINQFDGQYYTPLHRASQHGHWEIVRLLLNSNANVRLINCDGYNSLEVAIVNNHALTVREFLNHSSWAKSLRNSQIEMTADGKLEHLSTPLRKLIRYMPNEAAEVFTRCVMEAGGAEDPSYKIIFNYEFLEDQLAVLKWKQGEIARRTHTQSLDLPSTSTKRSKLLSCCQRQTAPNTHDTSRFDHHVHTLRPNHPLYLIITHRQYDLLKHPLIEQLIKRKWLQFSRTFFWILFLFYGNFSSLSFLYVEFGLQVSS